MIPISLFDPATSSVAAVEHAVSRLTVEKNAFIDGHFVSTRQTLENKFSPVDGGHIPGIASCGPDEIHTAVVAARRSFADGCWRRMDRSAVLNSLADQMQKAHGELALLDCLETGRALQNYYCDSIPKSIDALRWFAGNYHRLQNLPITTPENATAYIVHEPAGVVGLITPWNDPLVPAMWKLGASLMMGNSIVIKPSENSSLSLLRVAALAQHVGIPPGVFNVVPGTGAIAGAALAQHPDVDVIGFTGSSETARKILQYAGLTNLKRVEAECGGKSALIVTQNCSRLQEAADCIAQNIFYNQGQICSAPSRLIVERSVHKKLVPLVIEAAARFQPGHAFNINSRVGSLVSDVQRARVQTFLDEGDRTASRITRFPQPANPRAVPPTIYDNVDPRCRLAQDEIFGPVLCVIIADNFHNAIQIANSTRFGLAAGIWTDCQKEADAAAAELQAGIVHINSWGEDTMEAPFGGIRASGFGKDKSLLAFEGYSCRKTIWKKTLS